MSGKVKLVSGLTTTPPGAQNSTKRCWTPSAPVLRARMKFIQFCEWLALIFGTDDSYTLQEWGCSSKIQRYWGTSTQGVIFLLITAVSVCLTLVKIRWADYKYQCFNDLDEKAMSCLAPRQLFTGDVLITGLRCVFLSGFYYHLCSSHLPVTGVLGSSWRLTLITLLSMCSATICTKNLCEYNVHFAPLCSW